jgi:hypothetical protein
MRLGSFFKRLKIIALLASTTLTIAPTSGFSQEPPAAAALGAKLQPYIACLNRHSQRVLMSMDRYLRWADKKTGPKNMQKASLGLYSIYDTTDCAKGVNTATQANPRHNALEKSGSDYVQALQTLEPLLKTADQYYSQGDFKDDKLAKGKQMHPGLVAGFDAFATADKALRSVVEGVSDEVSNAELAAIEKTEGRKSRYLTLVLMKNAKVLVNAEKVEDLKSLDVADVTRKIGEFETSIQALEDYIAANKQERTNTMVVSSARTLLASTKGLMRRARDKVPYSTGDKMFLGKADTAWMVSDSPGKVIHDYNALVQRFNSRF